MFHFTFILNTWKAMPNNSKPISFKISRDESTNEYKIESFFKFDFTSINLILQSHKKHELFSLLYTHLETLKTFFKLKHPYKNLNIDYQNKIDGSCNFYFLQVSRENYELGFYPFSKFLKSHQFFIDLFPILYIKVEPIKPVVFVHIEKKQNILLEKFYDVFKLHFKDNLQFLDNVLILKEMNSEIMVKFFNVLVSFAMTRACLQSTKIFVSLIRSIIKNF
jgi:hypothetical protein